MIAVESISATQHDLHFRAGFNTSLCVAVYTLSHLAISPLPLPYLPITDTKLYKQCKLYAYCTVCTEGCTVPFADVQILHKSVVYDTLFRRN